MIEVVAIGAAGVAFFLSVLGTAVARRLAISWGFVDAPGVARHHRTPTPLLGGSAMLVAILVPLLVLV